MLSFKKKALYQMASKSNASGEEAPLELAAGQTVLIQPVSALPDGRLSPKLMAPTAPSAKSNDKINMSSPINNPDLARRLSVSKTDVKTSLGYGNLGLLANAYLEQSQMTAEEIMSVQASFYGVGGV